MSDQRRVFADDLVRTLRGRAETSRRNGDVAQKAGKIFLLLVAEARAKAYDLAADDVARLLEEHEKP